MARKKQSDHVSHERWLVSYADFITLLFAFFVVLYSTAQGDQKRAAQLATAIQIAFQQLGVFPGSASHAPLTSGQADTSQAVELLATTRSEQLVQPISAQQSDGAETVFDIAQLRRELEEQLAAEIRRTEISLRVERDGLVISLREIGFFDSGSPYLKQRSLGAFAKVANILAECSNQIRVEGHTDNVPIHTGQFASNWELSTARATEVVRLLIEDYGFQPQRLSAAGYSEFHPIASNSTDGGRQVNRRVDIVVLYLGPHVERPVSKVPKVRTSEFEQLGR